tara:strand:+ start:23338 stop:24591 length:1254 start_codon:yes stop_codon:yes gene_type:complete
MRNSIYKNQNNFQDDSSKKQRRNRRSNGRKTSSNFNQIDIRNSGRNGTKNVLDESNKKNVDSRSGYKLNNKRSSNTYSSTNEKGNSSSSNRRMSNSNRTFGANNSSQRNYLSNRREYVPSRINSQIPIENRNSSSNLREEQVYLYEESSDLIWGRHSTQAAFETGRPIHRIWCTSEVRSSSKFFQFLKDSKSSGVLVEEVSWARLAQITKGAVHQGIALQTASSETIDLDKLIEGCSGLNESPLLLALDGLTDPHNLGAIIRSAEALGAHGLVLPQRRSAGLTGSVAKVAAGALEHLPVARVVNLNRSLVKLKDQGYKVIGLAEEGESTLREVSFDGPLVVVIGSEDKGISLVTRRHCDQLVRIPLRGITTSLNASIATSVVLYEIARNTWMKGILGQAPSPKLIRAKFPFKGKSDN